MVTYKEIIEKLGFDPIAHPRDYSHVPAMEDDSTPSAYDVLTEEELEFLLKKMFEAQNKEFTLTPRRRH